LTRIFLECNAALIVVSGMIAGDPHQSGTANLAVPMLGWSDNWQPPPHHAHNCLAEAARISRRLQH
jgi:hypothetical protein